MGRAPKMLLLALVASIMQPATAFAVDGDGETTFMVPLQANHGLSAKLEADDDEIELTLRKSGQQAVYSAPGKVSAEGISVDFGSLGEFVVAYQPFRTLETHGPNRHCEGEPATTTEGYFRGTMRFRGEGDYARIEASGGKTIVPRPSSSPSIRRSGKWSPSPASPTPAPAPPPASSFDNRRGSAFADPPAPFAGFARYLRRPDAPDSWRGPLTVPLLGLGRVHLAGPGFHARMVPRLPEFE
jgi:hypothetical protein